MLLIILKLNFFYLLKVPQGISEFNSDHQNILLVIIILVSLTFFFTFMLKKPQLYPLGSIVILFLMLFFLEMLFSTFRYNQPLFDVIISGNYSLVFGMYFITLYYLYTNKAYHKLVNFLIVCSVILTSLFIIQYFLLNRGVIFLNLTLDRLRFGEYRIYQLGDFVNFMVVIAAGVLLKGKEKISKKNYYLTIACLLLGVFHIIFVAKTRSALVIVILSIFIMMIYKWRKDILKFVVGTASLSIIIILFSLTPTAKAYVESFGVYDASVSARERAIDLYMSQFYENPLLGMGFIRGVEGTDLYYLLRGTSGNLTRTDVGFIGYLNTFGIIGAILFVLLFFKVFRVILFLISKKIMINYLEVLGLFGFFTLSSVNLIAFDPQRIFYFVLYLSFVSYIYYINKYHNESKVKFQYEKP